MKPFRIFILLTISLILVAVPKHLVNACGFMVAPGEYRFWLLQPDLTQEKELTPFFFASSYLYKGNEHGATETYPKENIEEWLEQVRTAERKIGTGKICVRQRDIDSLLYHTPPDLFFSRTDSLARTNPFLRYLLLKENHQAFLYMQLSKKVEQIAANPDAWDEGAIPQANVSRIIDDGQGLFRQASSEFIRMRTAFQLMRLYGFNEIPRPFARCMMNASPPQHPPAGSSLPRCT